MLRKVPPSLFEVCPCGGWAEDEDKVTRDRMKKWTRTPGPDEVGGDDNLQDGEEEVDVVEVPVLPGGADEEGDQPGGGPVYLPTIGERAPPLQEDESRPGEDGEAEPADEELEPVPVRPDDSRGDGGEEVEERYPDRIDEPDSELEAPEAATPELVTMSRPNDELYEPQPAGGRALDPPPVLPGPVRILELEGPPVPGRRRPGINVACAPGPAAAPGGERREEHPG